MFIDIHAHVVEEETCPTDGIQTFMTPDQLLERYDELGVERACLLPIGSPETSVCVQSNEEILRIARRNPDRFIPFCNVDARCNGNHPKVKIKDILQYYKDKGCKGLGEVFPNLLFLDLRVQNLFRAAEEVQLPVIFHISPVIGTSYGLVDDPGLPGLEECLKRFPKLKFFGHSAPFWSEISQYTDKAARYSYPAGKVVEGKLQELFRKYDNLYGDLSAGSGANALSRDPEYAVKFLTEFQDRLCFGLDFCRPGNPAPLVKFLLDLRNSGKISEEIFEKVARKNAIRLFDL
jgi:predicted TIM-barrel fold metal-dependent hydrolase